MLVVFSFDNGTFAMNLADRVLESRPRHLCIASRVSDMYIQVDIPIFNISNCI